MTHFVHELPFGAQVLENGRTRFRLWAPAQDQVSLEIDGREPLPMTARDGGWFEVETDCNAGTPYRYRVNADLAVPDPASRAQDGDIHDPSLVVDPRAYRWRMADWKGRPWEEVVLYELHPGLLGGFKGIAEQLPRLRDLGVTAVELMPIADFPGRLNWGYDGVLPYAPDRAYGTPEALKALVDRAHELGLMIFLDVVYNHFGPEGNYLHVYAPQFFREDLQTPWGGAIDFRRPEVRSFFTNNAIYWINEYRFDGLRFDAVHAIPDPDWIDEMGAAVRAAAGPDRHIHLVLENDDNTASHLAGDFNAQWNDDMHHALHVLLTGETAGYYAGYAENPAEQLARGLREGFIYQGEPLPQKPEVKRGTPSGHLPPTAFVNFLQNHDQIGNRAMGERLAVMADPQALKAAMALLLLAPNIPMLFMGEEEGSRHPFLFFTDHHDELADAVREGRRREFASFPAFSDAKVRERIPDPNSPFTYSASRPYDEAEPERKEWLGYVRDLLRLRRERIVPRLKGSQAMDSHVIGEKAVLARWRMGDGATLTLVINFGDDPVRLDEPIAAEPLHAYPEEARRSADGLPGRAFAAWLEEAA
jgi:maltooligosyltrehalose trehalohydrolase